jgi:hypothetical protein
MGMLRPHLLDDIETAPAAQREVDDDQVGPGGGHTAERSGHVVGDTANLDPGLALEHPLQSRADQGVIVDDQHAPGTRIGGPVHGATRAAPILPRRPTDALPEQASALDLTTMCGTSIMVSSHRPS